ncbi:hypothetical protein [Meiothermus hypogaeus]|uniref:Uncharacterized protein n=2 Tax=Meiothermus hypogaeus TaxID=884155 RepID=A0A511R6A1_9DEIN|nr:hypothetical protein [Meiothermus hypogaeus]RIH74403.1 hypothetical protein Mhypo_03367 [Meiothermus hypogaeus]GEM85151.1 hypothetical protein MHY01S_33170 [Meiothermus hypogaeus NBRC 106114]
MRILLALLVLALGVGLAQWQNRQALITDFRQMQGVWTVKLDYVEVKDCNRDDCPAGIEVSNQNPLIRTFRFTPSTKIWLLKNAGEYFQATPQQLIQGLGGRNFGWSFDKYTPFYIKVNEARREILELKQMYLP